MKQCLLVVLLCTTAHMYGSSEQQTRVRTNTEVQEQGRSRIWLEALEQSKAQALQFVRARKKLQAEVQRIQVLDTAAQSAELKKLWQAIDNDLVAIYKTSQQFQADAELNTDAINDFRNSMKTRPSLTALSQMLELCESFSMPSVIFDLADKLAQSEAAYKELKDQQEAKKAAETTTQETPSNQSQTQKPTKSKAQLASLSLITGATLAAATKYGLKIGFKAMVSSNPYILGAAAVGEGMGWVIWALS